MCVRVGGGELHIQQSAATALERNLVYRLLIKLEQRLMSVNLAVMDEV